MAAYAVPKRPHIPADDPVLTEKGAADYTGWSVSSLAKSRLTGDGPTFLKFGRAVRYRRSDLEAWLASKRRRSTSDAGAAA